MTLCRLPTKGDWESIKERYANGEPVTAIAEDFDVSYGTIRNWLKRGDNYVLAPWVNSDIPGLHRKPMNYRFINGEWVKEDRV